MKCILIITALLVYSTLVFADEPIPASSITWLGVMGSVGGSPSLDKPVFVLLGPGSTKPDDHTSAMIIALGGRLHEAMNTWLREHPKALVVPVANRDSSAGKASELKATYAWVIDGDDNLNLELVRQGFIPLDTQTGVDPQKLEVPRADYDAFVQKALAAGNEAKEKKAGIWMDIPK